MDLDNDSSASDVALAARINDLSTNTNKAITDLNNSKQNNLISGTNIKTVNSTSILGSGDIKLETLEDIPIAGGPLAEIAKNIYEGGKIPSGTTFQDLFMKLFCDNIYPSTSVENGSYSISISNVPSITANKSNNALIEIGTKVTIDEVVAQSVTVSTTNPKISGLKHGYSDTIDGTINQSTSISVSWDTKQKDGEKYKLSASISKFIGTKPSDASASDAASCKLASCILEVTSGDNTYTVTETAPKYVGSHAGITSKYIVSNLGERDESHKTTKINSKSNEEQSANNKTSTFKLIGVYPIFTNGVESYTDADTAATQPDLATNTGQSKFKLINANSSDVTIAVSFAKHADAPYTLWIPNEWKLKKAWRFNGATGKWNNSEDTSNFVNSGTTTIKIQEKDVTYTIYKWSGNEGANKVKLTIGK